MKDPLQDGPAANAVKYGALSNETGRVEVSRILDGKRLQLQ